MNKIKLTEQGLTNIVKRVIREAEIVKKSELTQDWDAERIVHDAKGRKMYIIKNGEFVLRQRRNPSETTYFMTDKQFEMGNEMLGKLKTIENKFDDFKGNLEKK